MIMKQYDTLVLHVLLNTIFSITLISAAHIKTHLFLIGNQCIIILCQNLQGNPSEQKYFHIFCP